MNKKQTYVVGISAIVCLISIIGFTFAYWGQTETQQESNLVQSGCFSVRFTETADSDINIPNAFPLTDNDGMKTVPYTFTIENTCSIYASYAVNLEVLSTTTLSSDYVKAVLNTETPRILSVYQPATATISGATAYTLITGGLSQNETATYNLRLWIDENTPLNSSTQNQTFTSKVVVSTAADVKPLTGAELIASKVETSSDMATDDYGNVRYIGADPNNYVNFNGEKWRIIGVFDVAENEEDYNAGKTEKRIKLIRDSIGGYSWDSSTSADITSIQFGNIGYGINQWGASTTTDSKEYPGADIMQTLNSTYLTGGTGTCYGEAHLSYRACTFGTESGQIKPLSSEAQNLVDNAVWNTGTLSQHWGDISSTTKVADFYTAERSTNNGKICSSGTNCNDKVNRTTLWTGLVGLMYPSDYGYATAGGSTTNRATCLNTALYSWDGSGVSDCKNNSWLYNSVSHQWTMTSVPYSSYAYSVFFVYNRGNVKNYYAGSAYSVRPVVFLSSKSQITGTGDGSYENSYNIS